MADWDCEAYGPPPDEAAAASWPRCFISQTDRCPSRSICAHVVAAERRRVHARIHELAAAGDETAAYLAEAFPTPDGLLGGGQE